MEDLITKIARLRVVVENLKATNPALSGISDLLDEVLSKSLILVDYLLQAYALLDSALKIVSSSSLPLEGIDWQLAEKYLKLLEDSEDLNDALRRVSEYERTLLVDLIKALKKRGLLDIDIELHNGHVKVKVIRKKALKTLSV